MAQANLSTPVELTISCKDRKILHFKQLTAKKYRKVFNFLHKIYSLTESARQGYIFEIGSIRGTISTCSRWLMDRNTQNRNDSR